MALGTWELDNDTRGWIMCIISGTACVFGASIICVDAIVRLFPGKRSFRIQESSVFLACSLSLSFGVMLFSSLYSMLPESKEYLKKDGWSDQAAGLIMMTCFVGGFIGIQAVSRLLHQFIPSHVVDCDHSHKEPAGHHHHHHHDGHGNGHGHGHGHGDENGHAHSHDRSRKHSRAGRSRRRISQKPSSRDGTIFKVSENGNGEAVESTPLLTNGKLAGGAGEIAQRTISPVSGARGRPDTHEPGASARRPSIFEVPKRVMSFVKDTKPNCDETGSCYGFTDPCGQECFKHISNRTTYVSRHGSILRTTTGPYYPHGPHHADEGDGESSNCAHFRTSRATSRETLRPEHEEEESEEESSDSCCTAKDDEDVESQHHHHVPTNAFLSIGLQTSIAIALHKFPEGFITYATNHANPDLGFNVFMALFVHNISEGFAMCLPLYMALGSRWRAMLWSALLGGLSQPLGAGIAVLWFKVASRTNITPNSVVYASLFAITAGIMVSVALQLFVEAMSLNHNWNLCIFFGFIGMAILGFSNALFGGH